MLNQCDSSFLFRFCSCLASTPRSLVTEISGNLAYDSGDYLETIIPGSGVAKTELKGNYVIVFKRQPSGKWLIIEHVWTDKPAQ
jgi:ketosteroid isomerase-like protein